MAHKQGADRSGSEDWAGAGRARETFRALRANNRRKKGRSATGAPIILFCEAKQKRLRRRRPRGRRVFPLEVMGFAPETPRGALPLDPTIF